MASPAQIIANRANAQRSTGPSSPAGKAAVAQNRATHGLSSSTFFLLPGEDPAEFEALFTAFRDEYRSCGPTDDFLIEELARCQWKLRRVAGMEAALFSDASASSLADLFGNDTAAQALAKLGRYETRIRRDWYRALHELRTIRRDDDRALLLEARCQQADADARFARILQSVDSVPPAEPEAEAPPSPERPCHSKPIPAHLERELAAHRRRDPLFDPRMDASQMSKGLRKWFEMTASVVG